MGLRSGLKSGMWSGLLSGLNARADGAAILASLDFSTPVKSWSPAFTNFTSSYATDEWLLQEPSGTYANNVGSETLTNSGGLQGQAASGIWDGSSYTARKAWESANTGTTGLTASGIVAGEAGSSDISARIVVRSSTPQIAAYLMGKYTGGTPGGFIFEFVNATTVGVRIFNTAGTITATATADMCDGAWGYLAFFYDAAAGAVYLKTSRSSEVSNTGSTGDVVSTDSLTINDLPANHKSQKTMQVAYAGVCVGANAQAMYDEDFWQHASDPTGLLTTQTRASLISVPIAAGVVGHFADDTLPIGYNSLFTDTDKLGLYCNTAITNLIAESRLITGATDSNVTPTDSNADAADGMKAAATLAATANNGYQARLGTTVASTKYTASVYIKEVTVGVTGRVIMYDESGVSEIAATAFTATAAWQDITVTADTKTGGISTSVRVEVDTSGETVAVDFWQLNLGDDRGAIIANTGGSSALAVSDYQAAGSYVSTGKGELSTKSVAMVTPPANAYIVGTAGTYTNLRAIAYNNDGTTRGWMYNGTTAEDIFASVGVYVRVYLAARMLWDVDGGSIGYEGQLITNGTTKNGAELPYEAAPSLTYVGICLGKAGHNTTQNLNVYIQSVISYEGINEAAP